MAYKIKSIEMDAIRGVNKPLRIDFDEKLTVIHGPNGSGKSSILQALEWGLTGEIPYMRGGDFGREDAIVNAFTLNGRAKVNMSFSGPENFVFTRTKNRAKRTVGGKQYLTLDADQTYESDAAETYLAEKLDLDFEDVSRSKFLAQETIRDALTYSPAKRSAVIEKLLGTYEIKEFTKSLNQKRSFTSALKDIENRLEGLQEDRIRFIINLRRSLDEFKKKLVEKGYSGHQLEPAWGFKETKEIQELLNQLGQKYQRSLVHPLVSSDVESLFDANKRASDDARDLDRKRMKKVQDIQNRINTVQSLSGSYATALEYFKDYETLNIEELTEEKNDVTQQISEVGEKYEEAQKTATLLPSRLSGYLSDKRSLDTQRDKLEETVNTFGDEEALRDLIQATKTLLEETGIELERYSGQQRIVRIAVDILSETKQDDCPVCGQSINAQELVTDLRTKIGEEISKLIQELNEKQSQGTTKIRETENHLTLLKDLRVTIIGHEENVKTSKEVLEELVGVFSEGTDLSGYRDEFESKVQELRVIRIGLETRFNEYDDKIRQYNHLNKEISENKNKLQTMLEVSVEGQGLIKVAENQLKEYQGEVSTLSDTTEIDVVNDRIDQLSEILNFYRDTTRTENAEKELPALEAQKTELENRKRELLLLQGALSSISEISTRYQKENSLKQIRNLENLMNETYNAILGHPYFTRLKIDIEKEDPLQFSFRAGSEKELTYIPTRFSTAQRNMVALSIFMSNSKLMAGKLPLITLDDPTQNMDSRHKKAFAELVSNLIDDFQVIIATEDDDTKDYLLKQCPDAKYYELQGWDPQGPQIT